MILPLISFYPEAPLYCIIFTTSLHSSFLNQPFKKVCSRYGEKHDFDCFISGWASKRNYLTFCLHSVTFSFRWDWTLSPNRIFLPTILERGTGFHNSFFFFFWLVVFFFKRLLKNIWKHRFCLMLTFIECFCGFASRSLTGFADLMKVSWKGVGTKHPVWLPLDKRCHYSV